MRLSDAFEGMQEGGVPSLELTVKVVNVNLHASGPALDHNEDLKGYATFVEKVRRHQEDGKDLKEAVRLATDECISEWILVEFLKKYRNEVHSMFSLVYDEAIAKEVAREEGREEGQELFKAQLAARWFKQGKAIETIAYDLGIPLSEVDNLLNARYRQQHG
jgi:hypothetical protein